MELTDVIVEEKEISEYEIERDKPMPSILHALLQKRLVVFLENFYGTIFEILPEISQSITDKKTVPDISIYEKFEIDWSSSITSFDKIPLLNIEILSPEQTLTSLEIKVRSYFEAGVKSSWIVFPTMKAIAIYLPSGKYKFFEEDEVLQDTTVGIEIPLKEIFK